MFNSRVTLTPLLLTAYLLAGFVPAPARAQVAAGEAELLGSGDFPSITTDGQDGFVVVWSEFDDPDQEIFGSLLPPGGGHPEPRFQINTQEAGPQSLPQVAAGPGGDFMVVWQGGSLSTPAGGDGDREGVFGQAFSADAVKKGLQRRLSEGTASSQVSPRVAAREDGGFVAVWQDQRTRRFEIVARRFSAKGAPMGPDIPMKVGGEYNNGALVTSYPGGFAVAWNEGFSCSGGRSDGSFGAVARFDSSGQRVGRVFRVGSRRCGEGSRVTALAGSQAGALAILASSAGYSVQRFAPSGEPVGGQFSLSARPFCSGDRCDFISTAAMDDRGPFRGGLGGGHRRFLQSLSPGIHSSRPATNAPDPGAPRALARSRISRHRPGE